MEESISQPWRSGADQRDAYFCECFSLAQCETPGYKKSYRKDVLYGSELQQSSVSTRSHDKWRLLKLAWLMPIFLLLYKLPVGNTTISFYMHIFYTFSKSLAPSAIFHLCYLSLRKFSECLDIYMESFLYWNQVILLYLCWPERVHCERAQQSGHIYWKGKNVDCLSTPSAPIAHWCCCLSLSLASFMTFDPLCHIAFRRSSSVVRITPFQTPSVPWPSLWCTYLTKTQSW